MKILFFLMICSFSLGSIAVNGDETLPWLKRNMDTSPIKVIEKIKVKIADPTSSNDLIIQLNILLAEGYIISGEFQKSFTTAQGVVDAAIRSGFDNYENIGRFGWQPLNSIKGIINQL